MRSVSHSEITTYLDCQKKWDLIYHQGLKMENIHLKFGTMAHEVLENRVIPDESLYPELKEAFNISTWQNYFNAIFKELDEYFVDYEILHKEYRIKTDNMKGMIDVVWKNKETGRILITDYKFSNTDKGQEDILLDEQMYIYAVVYAHLNGLTLEDIDIGYINIPKCEMNKPRILKSGQLSKDKAQNVTYNKYVETIKELGLNMADYEDFLAEISGRTLLSISLSPINEEMAVRIMTNIDNVIKDMDKGYVLEKCTYQCKRCEFLQYCKYGKEIKKDEL